MSEIGRAKDERKCTRGKGVDERERKWDEVYFSGCSKRKLNGSREDNILTEEERDERSQHKRLFV